MSFKVVAKSAVEIVAEFGPYDTLDSAKADAQELADKMADRQDVDVFVLDPDAQDELGVSGPVPVSGPQEIVISEGGFSRAPLLNSDQIGQVSQGFVKWLRTHPKRPFPGWDAADWANTATDFAYEAALESGMTEEQAVSWANDPNVYVELLDAASIHHPVHWPNPAAQLTKNPEFEPFTVHKMVKTWGIVLGDDRYGEKVMAGFKTRRDAGEAAAALSDARWDHKEGRKREYEVEGRYGYHAVDIYDPADPSFNKVAVTGITKAVARDLAITLRSANSGHYSRKRNAAGRARTVGPYRVEVVDTINDRYVERLRGGKTLAEATKVFNKTKKKYKGRESRYVIQIVGTRVPGGHASVVKAHGSGYAKPGGGYYNNPNPRINGEYRKFGRHQFEFWTFRTTKHGAESVAKKVRDDGSGARITKQKGGYAVWKGPDYVGVHRSLLPNPEQWLQEADEEIEAAGTEGAFTKQARRAGYKDTMAFARAVMKGWRSGQKTVKNKKTRRMQRITKKTMGRANFAINAQKRRRNTAGIPPKFSREKGISTINALLNRLERSSGGQVEGALTAAQDYLRPLGTGWMVKSSADRDEMRRDADFYKSTSAKEMALKLAYQWNYWKRVLSLSAVGTYQKVEEALFLARALLEGKPPPLAGKTRNPRDPQFSWSTHKTGDGWFSFRVTRMISRDTPNEMGHYLDTELVKEGTGYRTRARAKSAGQQWARKFRNDARKAKGGPLSYDPESQRRHGYPYPKSSSTIDPVTGTDFAGPAWGPGSSRSELSKLVSRADLTPGQRDAAVRRLWELTDEEAEVALKKWKDPKSNPAVPNEKVTLYYQGAVGNIVAKEGRYTRHGTGGVHYVPKGGRKERLIMPYYSPFIMVVRGWGHPEPQSLYDPSTRREEGDVTTVRGRYRGRDPRWVSDWLTGPAAELPVLVLYQGGKIVSEGRQLNPQIGYGPDPLPRAEAGHRTTSIVTGDQTARPREREYLNKRYTSFLGSSYSPLGGGRDYWGDPEDGHTISVGIGGYGSSHFGPRHHFRSGRETFLKDVHLTEAGRKWNPAAEGDFHQLVVTNDQGTRFGVRFVEKGMRYGAKASATHPTLEPGTMVLVYEGREPMVEFYDLSHPDKSWGQEGQFVSRYDLSTLLGGRQDVGLMLQGGIPSWYVSPNNMAEVLGFGIGRYPEVKPSRWNPGSSEGSLPRTRNGGTTFLAWWPGENENRVFQELQEMARQEEGYEGYTGTIAEKPGFTVRTRERKPFNKALAFARADIDENEKWGNAFAVPYIGKDGKEGWLFYGWASI
jgi:hypothetical protein